MYVCMHVQLYVQYVQYVCVVVLSSPAGLAAGVPAAGAGAGRPCVAARSGACACACA